MGNGQLPLLLRADEKLVPFTSQRKEIVQVLRIAFRVLVALKLLIIDVVRLYCVVFSRGGWPPDLRADNCFLVI